MSFSFWLRPSIALLTRSAGDITSGVHHTGCVNTHIGYLFSLYKNSSNLLNLQYPSESRSQCPELPACQE